MCAWLHKRRHTKGMKHNYSPPRTAWQAAKSAFLKVRQRSAKGPQCTHGFIYLLYQQEVRLHGIQIFEWLGSGARRNRKQKVTLDIGPEPTFE